MKNNLQNSFLAPIESLSGVGPKVVQQLAKLLDFSTEKGFIKFVDLLHLMPRSMIERTPINSLKEARENDVITVKIIIDKHYLPPYGKKKIPYRILGHDQDKEINLLFFHSKRIWLEKNFPINNEVIISGRISIFHNRLTMVHPDYVVCAQQFSQLPEFEPIYPTTSGLSNKYLRKLIEQIFKNIPLLPEWLNADLIKEESFLSYNESLRLIHCPKNIEEVNQYKQARRRLAFDELLAHQLSLALIRSRVRRQKTLPLLKNDYYTHNLRKLLPFVLTNDQEAAIKEISSDLSSDVRMLRLLQGDVGSGKTVVALFAMLQAIENGGQAALMVPTEILARQHYQFISYFAEKLKCEAVILTGREKGKKRKEILEKINDNEAKLIIGTHALIQEDVLFYKLVLVIIDEQHRFGVQQRLTLSQKGAKPHMLVMTATPIPRTLILTNFGDMNITSLREKPKGRKPIKTAVLSLDRIEEVVVSLEKILQKGEKIYWICPLIEESEVLDLTPVLERFQYLEKTFKDKITLLHGKMKTAEKEKAMADFKGGITPLLIATTVVEVGVDVSDATVIIIEHAERFGLAQLHQLRGRVGRSERASSCILLYKPPLSYTARERLKVIRSCEDGFHIANEDLRLRGEGDLLGVKQSGLPAFKIANPFEHEDLLPLARKVARNILKQDPNLSSEQGLALQNLLYLYRLQEAIQFLHAG